MLSTFSSAGTATGALAATAGSAAGAAPSSFLLHAPSVSAESAKTHKYLFMLSKFLTANEGWGNPHRRVPAKPPDADCRSYTSAARLALRQAGQWLNNAVRSNLPAP